MFIYLTVATIRRVGLSPEPPGVASGSQTYRDHLYVMTMLILLAFGALVTLAVLVPFRFLAAADPYATPAGVRPPWYMLAPYAIEHIAPVPAWASGGALVIAAFGVLLLPFLVRGRGPSTAGGRARWIGLALLAVWIGLSLIALRLDRR
jgi:quinol-cytochrome oxidoreductase complex cytochrome b subunit